MSKELREAYNQIAESYLSKKQPPWQDFLRFLGMLEWEQQSTVIDIGAGNGRNLLGISADLHIAFDLSPELLRGYVGPAGGQRIAGALPKLPFRDQSSDRIICIAVIHHIRERQEIIKSLMDIRRTGTQTCKYIFSVWRRWRRGLREKLVQAIKEGKDTDQLINHDRPWYNSQREIQATRFYHYYTYQELYQQLTEVELYPKTVKYLGGRHDDGNIFVEVCSQKTR